MPLMLLLMMKIIMVLLPPSDQILCMCVDDYVPVCVCFTVHACEAKCFYNTECDVCVHACAEACL